SSFQRRLALSFLLFMASPKWRGGARVRLRAGMILCVEFEEYEAGSGRGRTEVRQAAGGDGFLFSGIAPKRNLGAAQMEKAKLCGHSFAQVMVTRLARNVHRKVNGRYCYSNDANFCRNDPRAAWRAEPAIMGVREK